MRTIGLTGGMGTGKGTVAAIFMRLGAYVLDADEISREVVYPGSNAWKELKDAFGESILLPDDTVNRRALAEQVFRDEEKRYLLNRIVHPPVREEIMNRIQEADRSGNHPVAVANVPLLFEAGMQDLFDAIIVVTCTAEQQVARCMKRDALSEEEVRRRIACQLPLEEKARRADYVIANDGTLDGTEQQVLRIWEELKDQ